MICMQCHLLLVVDSVAAEGREAEATSSLPFEVFFKNSLR